MDAKDSGGQCAIGRGTVCYWERGVCYWERDSVLLGEGLCAIGRGTVCYWERDSERDSVVLGGNSVSLGEE